ncbi:Acetyl esterase [Burkholderia puraquae]|nr:Acetyl esterase [Burkholderia puraquae]
MNHATHGLSADMQAFIDTAARFRSCTDDWPSRRAAFARQCAHFTPPAPQLLVVTDRRIGGVMTRCFVPAGDAPPRGWPVLVFFHGGGWTTGDHTTHDWFAYALLACADLAIVAVDYRLAPEACFPAPLDDGLAVWDALASTALPFDPTRRAVAGDSAGGTLAAALCVALRERAEAQPAAQVLVYPVLSAADHFPSMREHAGAPMLPARGLAESIALYVPNEIERRTARAMPLECERFDGLAPALVVVAMHDVLRDQGIDFVQRVRDAGGDAHAWLAHGLVHGAMRATELAETRACYDRIASFLIERGAAIHSARA